jgi:hypothetical protein
MTLFNIYATDRMAKKRRPDQTGKTVFETPDYNPLNTSRSIQLQISIQLFQTLNNYYHEII